MNDKILIVIPSYNDHHIVECIKYYSENADDASRLYFIICYQDNDIIQLKELRQYDNVDIIHVDLFATKGLGWALNVIENCIVLEDYDYFLITEPHTYVVKGWDTYHVKMMKIIGNHAIINNYPPPFTYDDLPKQSKQGIICGINGVLVTSKHIIPGARNYFTEPAFVKGVIGLGTAGMFGHISALIECKHDPNYVFNMNETYYAIQLYTHGYDICYTNERFLFHYYVTNNKGNENDASRFNRKQVLEKRDDEEKRQRRFLAYLGFVDSPDIDLLGFEIGKVRSIKQFEIFAGIDFASGSVSENGYFGYYDNSYISNDIEYFFGIRIYNWLKKHSFTGITAGDAFKKFHGKKFINEGRVRW